MKERFVATTLAVGLLAGCDSNTASEIASIDPTTVELVERGSEEIDLDGNTPTVDFRELSPTLPKAIAWQIGNVAALQLRQTLTGPLVPLCSAVRISDDEYISAAHCMKDEHNNPMKIMACDGLHISTKQKPHGQTTTTLRQVGDYIKDKYTETPDVMLTEIRDDPAVAPPYTHPTRIADESPKAGDPLYFVNYQPTAADEARSPYEDSLLEGAVARGLNRPAILGGIVFQALPNDDLEVIVTATDSEPTNPLIRSGASGGSVYNEKGELVGIAESTPEARDGLQKIGIGQEWPTQSVIVQPVNKDIVSNLHDQLAAKTSC